MKCPKDETTLATVDYEGAVQVDRCPTCRGMWLDQGELEQIERTKERDYTAELRELPDLVDKAYAMASQSAAPPLDCPNCGRTMERREHAYCSQILIDVCPQCHGVWLDADEIGALEVFFERAAADTADMRVGFFSGLRAFF